MRGGAGCHGRRVYWFAGRAKPIDSLAIMPFVNVGGEPNTEYLSDGITENLIHNLSQLPRLRVLPRGRVFGLFPISSGGTTWDYEGFRRVRSQVRKEAGLRRPPQVA